MDLPEDKLNKANNLLTRLLFKKAQQEADKSMIIKGLTNQKLNQEVNELNNGSRREYLNEIENNNLSQSQRITVN